MSSLQPDEALKRVSIFPTDHIGKSPLHALQSYALPEQPAFPHRTKEKLLDDASQQLSIKSPNFESSLVTRNYADAAKTFWREFLSDGKGLSIVNDNEFINDRIKHLRANLSETEPLSESAAEDLERWNNIAEDVDAAQHVVFNSESLSKKEHTFSTYEQRERKNAQTAFYKKVPCRGGEVGLTTVLATSAFLLANRFVNSSGFFKDHMSLHRKNWMSAALAGSGTTDMCASQVYPPQEEDTTEQIEAGDTIFEHKPSITVQSLVRFMTALKLVHVTKVDVRLEWTEGNPTWTDQYTLLDPGIRAAILQVVEQLEVDRADACILGSWDCCLVFNLEGKVLHCSDIISCRDSDWVEEKFETGLLKRARLENNTQTRITDCASLVKPLAYSFLETLVALMLRQNCETKSTQPYVGPMTRSRLRAALLESADIAQGIERLPPTRSSLNELAPSPTHRAAEQRNFTRMPNDAANADPFNTHDTAGGVFDSTSTTSRQSQCKMSLRLATSVTDSDDQNCPRPQSGLVWYPIDQEYWPIRQATTDATVSSHATVPSVTTLPPHSTLPWMSTLSSDATLASISRSSSSSTLVSSGTVSSLVSDEGSDCSQQTITLPKMSSSSSSDFVLGASVTSADILLTEYLSSGRCYDAFRGKATLLYPGFQETIPIVAKYVDVTATTEPRFHERYHGLEARRAMFQEERALLKLKHTGLVPLLYGIYTLDEEMDKLWMIMEDCGTQVDMSSDDTRIATFKAYQAIQEAKVLHRDVTPRHVLSSDGGRTVKIIDWEDAYIEEEVGAWIYGCGRIDEEAEIDAMVGYDRY